jgi:hypothetical protein
MGLGPKTARYFRLAERFLTLARQQAGRYRGGAGIDVRELDGLKLLYCRIMEAKGDAAAAWECGSESRPRVECLRLDHATDQTLTGLLYAQESYVKGELSCRKPNAK